MKAHSSSPPSTTYTLYRFPDRKYSEYDGTVLHMIHFRTIKGRTSVQITAGRFNPVKWLEDGGDPLRAASAPIKSFRIVWYDRRGKNGRSGRKVLKGKDKDPATGEPCVTVRRDTARKVWDSVVNIGYGTKCEMPPVYADSIRDFVSNTLNKPFLTRHGFLSEGT